MKIAENDMPFVKAALNCSALLHRGQQWLQKRYRPYLNFIFSNSSGLEKIVEGNAPQSGSDGEALVTTGYRTVSYLANTLPKLRLFLRTETLVLGDPPADFLS